MHKDIIFDRDFVLIYNGALKSCVFRFFVSMEGCREIFVLI